MSLVWAMDLPDSEKIVLLALADCANDEGHCWPSMKTLSEKCSKSDRTVQAAISSLCAKGHLTRREVLGKGCNYTVHPRSHCTPEAASPRNDCATPPKPVRETPEAASDKPSKNHQEPSNKARGRAVQLVLPDWVPADPWLAFVRMRRATPKVAFTDDAAKRVIAKIDKLRGEGHCPVKLLDKAIERGWRTVFPDDDTKAAYGKPAVGLTASQWRERAEFYDRVQRREDAADCRRRAAELERAAA